MDKANTAELKARFKKQREQLHAQIRARLPLFPQRAQEEGLTLDYDPGEDILYIFLGNEPRPAMTHRVSEGVSVRLSEDTMDIIGVEFENYSKAHQSQRLTSLVFADLYPVLKRYHTVTFKPQGPATEIAAELEKELPLP